MFVTYVISIIYTPNWKKTVLLQFDQLQVITLSQCNVCVEICMINYFNGEHYTSSIC